MPIQRIDHVRFTGAAHFEITERGHELHVYGSFEQAVKHGLDVQAAAKVFGLLALNGGCVSDQGIPGVSCISMGCTGTCQLYSVPRNWKFGDPEPQHETQPAYNDPARIYFCLCKH